MSRTDKLVASLLCGVMGAFGGGMLGWMLDAGTWWIVGPSIAGFLLVTCYTFFFGLAISEELTKLSDESPAAAFLFDPVDGFIPTVVATAVGGLLVGILLMNGWAMVLSVIAGVGLGAISGTIAFVARALSRRDLSKENPDRNGNQGES